MISPEPSDPRLAGTSDALLDELGELLIDFLRLRPADEEAIALLLSAARTRALAMGWAARPPVQHGHGLHPWQERLAIGSLLELGPHVAGIQAIAKACGLSASQFSRAFKAQFGASPQTWRLRTRIQRAKHMMLHTSLTLTEIAGECGFSEQSHFNHVFLKQVGSCPSVWRQTNAPATPEPISRRRHPICPSTS